MSNVYISLGGYKNVNLEMYCQTTEAYPEGEVFAVFDEEEIAASLWNGPADSGVELENPILQKVAKELEEDL